MAFFYELDQKGLEAIHSAPSVASIDVQPSAPPMPEEQSDAFPLNPPSYEEAIGADNGNVIYQTTFSFSIDSKLCFNVIE